MEFRKIDKSNYWDCISLTVDDSQEGFVADNKQSLVEAAYEDVLYTLGIYHKETMVGFVLYDYDDTFSGWSMSRFMIGKQFQGKGYGKMAARAFLDYFKENIMLTNCISVYHWKIQWHAKCMRLSDLRKSKRLNIHSWVCNSKKCKW